MTIEINDSCTVCTGTGVDIFRLLSIKGRIELESKGIRFKGRATRSLIAAEFGLKPRDKHEKFIAAIQKKIDELRAKERYVDNRGKNT